ncbi:hypothetical protein STEG23_008167 [Scotinomys teguina]
MPPAAEAVAAECPQQQKQWLQNAPSSSSSGCRMPPAAEAVAAECPQQQKQWLQNAPSSSSSGCRMPPAAVAGAMSKRMSAFQINLNPLKEPLGFIKVLEWFASIFAFATCGGFKGNTEIQASCPSKVGDNKTVTAAFGYPFRLNQASFHPPPNVNVCDVKWENHVLIGDYSSSAQFYVTFAVFVFLYCIAALVLYVGYTNLYRDSRKLPMIDFIVTLVATFLWLVSSSAWAKALTDIKVATGQHIIEELDPYLQVPGSGCREDEGNLAAAAPHPHPQQITSNPCELLQSLASCNDLYSILQLFHCCIPHFTPFSLKNNAKIESQEEFWDVVQA